MGHGRVLICSSRYAKVQDEGAGGEAEPLEQFWGRHVEKLRFKENRELLKKEGPFVAQAMDISETFSMDMDIFEIGFGVTAEIYIRWDIYSGKLVEKIGKLLNMSDQASVSPCGNGGFQLKLDIFTRDMYLERYTDDA